MARDATTGQIGVAVASCVLAVGARVPGVETGAGAVAAQASSADVHRETALSLLARGIDVHGVLAAVAALPDSGQRQIGVVDATGAAAAYTGEGCAPQASHAVGDGVCAQANLVVSTEIPQVMLDACAAQVTKPLADRLLAALQAAQDAGGDVRGRQSATLRVCDGTAADADSDDPFAPLDLRVDDAGDPVAELRRVRVVQQAHGHLVAGVRRRAEGWASATGELMDGYRLAPDDAQLAYWDGLALAASDRWAEAEPVLRAAARSNPNAAQRLRQHADTGSYPVTDRRPQPAGGTRSVTFPRACRAA